MKALRLHCKCRWVLLYVERWLKASMQQPDGTLTERHQGTPQGGVVSPVLANLFLHYAFDAWVRREMPHVPFCRYADDGLLHLKWPPIVGPPNGFWSADWPFIRQRFGIPTSRVSCTAKIGVVQSSTRESALIFWATRFAHVDVLIDKATCIRTSSLRSAGLPRWQSIGGMSHLLLKRGLAFEPT